MRRFICFLMCAVMLAAPMTSGALQEPDGLDTASAAVLINAETGAEVCGRNTQTPVEAAGLRRLPALLAVCRAFDGGEITESTPLRVSERAARERGATAFLAAGERIEAGPVLKAAVMLTAGDAIRALLEAAYPADGGKSAVNSVLSEFGAAPADDPMGEGCAFTVGELAAVTLGLAKSPAWLKYSSCYTDTLTHESGQVTELVNPNRLVRFYSGCFGAATGSVGQSEYAGAFIAKRAGTTFCAVITGMPDSKSRFALASSMLDSGFAAYRAAAIERAKAMLVPVTGGVKGQVEAEVEGGAYILLPAGDLKITSEAELPGFVEAPVEKGSVLGRLIIKNASGEAITELCLKAAETVEKAGFADAFTAAARSWLRHG
ncbi:MAG: hypothetical protein II536_05080 [Clostridia bacterium]|nr:hypothetical protein [Clostridia bacterium]